MFKTLFFFVVLGFLLLLLWSLFMVFKNLMVKEPKSNDDLDKLISELKVKIEIEERKSELGVSEAELRLSDYKQQLKKAQELKEKFKTI